MDLAGLPARYANTYPHELDGGRRQRVGIARALALNPSFLGADEPVSVLDASIQAQVLHLMQQLQKDLGLTYLFISHDLGVVKHISTHVAVMYLGVMVEKASVKDLFSRPLHPYTQALLSAVPIPSIDYHRERIVLEGDVPSPVNPKPGCRFAGRCRDRQERCRQETPQLREVEPGRFVACHYVNNLRGSKGGARAWSLFKRLSYPARRMNGVCSTAGRLPARFVRRWRVTESCLMRPPRMSIIRLRLRRRKRCFRRSSDSGRRWWRR